MSELPKELLAACDAIAGEWVYAIHAWRGRSPEFMQTQKKRLGETIAQFVHAREQAARLDEARKWDVNRHTRESLDHEYHLAFSPECSACRRDRIAALASGAQS